MGSADQGPEGLLGQSIAGYRLEKVLGTGATGAVYLASRLDSTPEQIERTEAVPQTFPPLVAIKILFIPWQLSKTQANEFQARFLRESEIVRQLDHPHILPVLLSGQDAESGRLYMVLPYCEETLAERLSRAGGSVPLAEAATIADQLGQALEYAHSKGVVHRDVKPANVLLDSQGNAMLADFSILRLLDSSKTTLTATGGVLGTPEYMAPEQARGEEVSPQADQYSLATMVYEMVTGRPPFTGDSPTNIVLKQVQEAPARPQLSRPDLPEPAEAALLKALSKRPNERFALCAQFAEAFQQGLAGQYNPFLTQASKELPRTIPDGELDNSATSGLAGAVPQSPRGRTTSGMRAGNGRLRRRSAWIVAVVAVMLVAVAVLVLFNGQGHATGSPSIALRSATNTLALHPTAKATKGGTGTTPRGPTNTTSSGSPRPTSTTASQGNPPTVTPTSTSTPTPSPTTPPPPQTWPETAGGVAHTWTNYTNAGGYQGPSVAAYQTVQIACRLTGFKVADGNTWWYRIAQSPWNNAYYVSADAFYNNGATSGPLTNTPFVDMNVVHC